MPFQGEMTRKGYVVMECISAFQKSVRRGLEEDALYWAAELDESSQKYATYLWRRIKIITSEDIGIAAGPGFASDIRALYENWKETDGIEKRLFLVHAVMLLARAKKTRIVDNAATWVYARSDNMPVPDYAIDKHSKRGREMGRGEQHWFEEGSKIANIGMHDSYKDAAERILLKYEQSDKARERERSES